ncbi:hypothetical protein B0J13DRAFT_25728 [Dactylonectria estremocensis]|uniref:Uncharacterized protein n=1 Tax=Dactylonectria estremocensis TaxID=1079267 RepID=A0A9P9FJN3_9HYPO|nr:hypothetical protein B0J13DRAFT_25728 [Dactylonectria estremocensis]
MALTVKQLNGDASFLLTLEPIGTGLGQAPFRILLDPWIPGPESIRDHDAYSTKYCTAHEKALRITSLRQLPEPDLVIISRDRSDHCNKDTLKQLSRTNSKTVILAEPAAAKLIRSWKLFDKEKVLTLQKWEDPRVIGRETTTRVSIPPQHQGGDPGEVTVSFITQKKDRWRVHAAVGITYRPPPSRPMSFYRPVLTPPATPKTSGFRRSSKISSPPPLSPMILHFRHRSDTSTVYPFPAPPTTLQSKRASYQMTLPPFPFPLTPLVPASPSPPESPPPLRRMRSNRSTRSITSISPHARDRSISVIFSPHGITYQSLESYATTHLVAEAALPLTALLHCFDAVAGPWWLPGSINSGLPDGQKIATALGAKAWVSTHDAGRNTRQGWAGRMAGRMARTRRYRESEVQQELGKAAWDGDKKAPLTEILSLAAGEDVSLTSEGVWDPEMVTKMTKKARRTSMIY